MGEEIGTMQFRVQGEHIKKEKKREKRKKEEKMSTKKNKKYEYV
jgi:hypothetical protein